VWRKLVSLRIHTGEFRVTEPCFIGPLVIGSLAITGVQSRT
jgi:hypothetical protein